MSQVDPAMTNLAKTIDDAFEKRNDVTPATKGQVRDAVETALNLLDSGNSSNLTVTLNEHGTSSVTITAVDFSATGLSVNAAANSWAGTADIGAANTDLTAALSTLRSQSQAFGSNLSTVQIRQDFTKSMINTLQTGADSLTLGNFVNSATVSGAETITGGSCTMPIDKVTEATTRSMTRNGRNSTAPI